MSTLRFPKEPKERKDATAGCKFQLDILPQVLWEVYGCHLTYSADILYSRTCIQPTRERCGIPGRNDRSSDTYGWPRGDQSKKPWLQENDRVTMLIYLKFPFEFLCLFPACTFICPVKAFPGEIQCTSAHPRKGILCKSGWTVAWLKKASASQRSRHHPVTTSHAPGVPCPTC